ncbi:MAG: VOC family protein [Marinoscillum sp.]|uniref:VOC family protein n=1 Tax=Marinoscillum sp. TaxID=2024838 RepID=UPI0032FD25A1
MMAVIVTYLTFSGNCRQAMTFYQQCLGGQLKFQTVAESPLSEEMSEPMKACIVHATLSNGVMKLMGSDIVPESGLVKGNSVSLSLTCTSTGELKRLYRKLSSGGTASHPPQETHWGALFGELTDKFGNHWLLSCAHRAGSAAVNHHYG